MSLPLSRVWACVFSCSLFALLWTRKMKKTRMWILIDVLLSVMVFGMIVAIRAGENELAIVVVAILVIAVLPPLVHVWYMYKWVTEYNMANYGHKSLGDMKKPDDR